MVHFTLNLKDIEEKLSEDLKVPLPPDLQKEIEFEFHAADYHTLDEVCTGLKVVAGFIIKVSKTIIIVPFNHLFKFEIFLNSCQFYKIPK